MKNYRYIVFFRNNEGEWLFSLSTNSETAALDEIRANKKLFNFSGLCVDTLNNEILSFTD